MQLRSKQSGESLAAAISAVVNTDYEWIAGSAKFKFDWKIESDSEVYKIYLLDNSDSILGLMSLIDRPDEYRVHLNLIETASDQRGAAKEIEHIAGCLLAFACRLAFKRQYYGFLSLQPKTELIDFYQDRYGFQQFGRLLAVEGESSLALIKKYLSDEEGE